MKVIMVGGGTGSFAVLSGLKKYPLDITSLVTVADSGGSTGILRDEFGVLPPGDFRMALVALSDESISQDLRELFLYRFNKGNGLKGHNFGNLFLVALTEMFNSYDRALKFSSNLLRVKGTILPISNEGLTLVAEYEDGTVKYGEKNIDNPDKGHNGKLKITKLWVESGSKANKNAVAAILDADFVIVGPGDLYTSLLANFVVGGVASSMSKTKAKFVYVANLMNKYGQTFDFGLKDYISEIEKYTLRSPDYVLVNNSQIDKDILKKYELEEGFPVIDNLSKNAGFEIIRADLLATGIAKRKSGDSVRRSLVRHDVDKLAWELFKIFKGS